MTVEIQAQAPEASANEEAIGLWVRRFYERAQKDPMLARIFAVSVPDWEHHIGKIHDFWSRALLGTQRYAHGHMLSGWHFPVCGQGWQAKPAAGVSPAERLFGQSATPE